MFLVGLSLFNKNKSERIGNYVQFQTNLTPKCVASKQAIHVIVDVVGEDSCFVQS